MKIRVESMRLFFALFLVLTANGCGNLRAVRTLASDSSATSSVTDALPSFLIQLGGVTRAPGAPGTANQGADACSSVATDSVGNTYCAGETTGAVSEANGGSRDAVVMKFNSSGVIQWVTQLGAVTKAPGAPVTANQGMDACTGVAVDSLGNVYCGGYTYGALGEINGGNGDAFVMKLNSSGVIQWVTQLGAVTVAPGAPVTANQGDEGCNGVAVDSSGNVFCAGYTSGDLGESGGAGGADAFVMKVNSSGVLQWVAQLGTTTKVAGAPLNANQGYDECKGVAVDSSGNAFCAGFTTGAIAEANAGNYDAFVLKLNTNGAIQWATQLGATTKAPGAPIGANQSRDRCDSVAVDGSGNVYCGGSTEGIINEANAGIVDAFVMKLSATGAIQWATQLGAVTKAAGAPVSANQGEDHCLGIAVDTSDNVYCSGWTDSDVSEANGGLGFLDSMVMKFNSNGVLQWVTQLGSVTKAPGAPASTNQDDEQCRGVSVDSSGNVYCAGTAFGGFGEAMGGNYDAFILRLDSTGSF